MKKKIATICVAAAVVALCAVLFVLHRQEECDPALDCVKFSMFFYNAHYCGGTEEADESAVGEQIGTSAQYHVDPDASNRQKKGGDNYVAPIFQDLESDDYTSVIALNHKGKYVRVYFVWMDSDGYQMPSDFGDVVDIFQLGQKQVEKILVNDQTQILDREKIEKLMEALLVPYPYVNDYGDDYSSYTFAFKITVVFEDGKEFVFYVDRMTRLLNAYYAEFQLTRSECRLFEELAGIEEE